MTIANRIRNVVSFLFWLPTISIKNIMSLTTVSMKNYPFMTITVKL